MLKNKEEVFINLTHNPSKSATFSINNRYYSISLKGFWTPRYVVSYEGENILELAYSLWKTSGDIKFLDGSVYRLKYESKSGFKMLFLDGESEILSYAMDHKAVAATGNRARRVGVGAGHARLGAAGRGYVDGCVCHGFGCHGGWRAFGERRYRPFAGHAGAWAR